MKIIKKTISILLVLVMLLAMSVPAFAASDKYQSKYAKIYRTIGNSYVEIPVVSIKANEVTKTDRTITYPGYGYPVEVYSCTGKTTLTLSVNLYRDVVGCKYDPSTGDKTIMYQPESEKYDGFDYSFTYDDTYFFNEPGLYVFYGVFTGNGAEPVAIAIDVKMDDTAQEDPDEESGNKLLYFKDVPASHWAHDAVMDMVKIKLFKGTTEPDANGAALFSPDKTMTYAEFITVITRHVCPAYVEEYMYLSLYHNWYIPYCKAAVEAGISDDSGYEQPMYTQPVTREHMAKLLVRACNKSGEKLGADKYTAFPDYDKVSPEYKDYVAIAYAEGLLCGIDNAGTFDPQGTLTRAQAATVLYRLVDPSTRVDI